MIRYVFQDRIVTDFSFTFYGFKVETTADNFQTISVDFLENLLKKTTASGKYDNMLWICIKKTKIKNYPDDFKDAYKTDIYYITANYDVYLTLSEIKTLMPLSGEELASAIFSLHTLADEYVFNPERKELKRESAPFTKSTILLPPASRTYTSFFQNAIEMKKKKGKWPFYIYKGVRTVKKPDLSLLFEIPWTGAMFIRVNLNNIYSILKSRVNVLADGNDRLFWKQFAERYKAGEESVVLFETTFITDERLPEKDVTVVFSALGQEYLPWAKFYNQIIKKSPFKIADSDFEIILETEKASGFFVISYTKNNIVKANDVIYGTNRSQEIVFYSPFEEAQSPHMLIIAPTRSGKSFMLQNLTTMMANIDLEGLWSGQLKKKEIPVWVRYFDVGFSAEFWVKLMERRGFDVAVINPEPSIRINIFEVDDLKDIEIATKLVSLILSSKGEEPLTATEEGYVKMALRQLLDRNKMPPKHLIRLKEEFPDYYEKARQLGYSDADNILLLKEKQFKHFTYPTVSDVIRVLNSFELNKRETEPESCEPIRNAVLKLKNLKAIENFASYSDGAFINSKFMYLDLSFLKSSTNFIAIYAALLTKVVKKITEVNPHEIKLFICDEFHNVIKVKMFSEFYETLVREAAKYNLYLIFVSQNPADVPFDIANNVATKIFLKPAQERVLEENKPSENFEKAVQETFRITSEQAINELKRLPKYTSFVVFPSGFFTLSLPVDKLKTKLFESRTITEIKTPDGIVIRKSYAGGGE